MSEYLVSGKYRDPEDGQWESFTDLIRLDGDLTAEKFAIEVAEGCIPIHGPKITSADVKVTGWEKFTGDGIDCLTLLNWPGRAKQQRKYTEKVRQLQAEGMTIPEDELIRIIKVIENRLHVSQTPKKTASKKRGWSTSCNVQ